MEMIIYRSGWLRGGIWQSDRWGVEACIYGGERRGVSDDQGSIFIFCTVALGRGACGFAGVMIREREILPHHILSRLSSLSLLSRLSSLSSLSRSRLSSLSTLSRSRLSSLSHLSHRSSLSPASVQSQRSDSEAKISRLDIEGEKRSRDMFCPLLKRKYFKRKKKRGESLLQKTRSLTPSPPTVPRVPYPEAIVAMGRRTGSVRSSRGREQLESLCRLVISWKSTRNDKWPFARVGSHSLVRPRVSPATDWRICASATRGARYLAWCNAPSPGSYVPEVGRLRRIRGGWRRGTVWTSCSLRRYTTVGWRAEL